MADKTTRKLTDEILGVDAEGWTEYLTTAVWYEKGGTNMVSGEPGARGYYAAARIERRRDGMVSFMLFTGGIKRFLEPARAFSAKKLAAIEVDPAVIARLKAHLLAKRVEEADTRARDKAAFEARRGAMVT